MNRTRMSRLMQRIGGERWLRVAPFFALGPVSGPLTAGIVFNFRGGRPVLGTLYGVALGLWLVVAPVEAAQILHASAAHLL